MSLRVENSTLDQSTLLAYLARLAAAEGQAERALRLAGGASALRDEAGTQLFRFDGQLLERALESARRRLGESVALAADPEGRAMGRESAFAYAAEALEVGRAAPPRL